MKKFLKYFFKALTVCFVAFAIIACVSFALLQTDWCRSKISALVTEKAEEQGIKLKLGKIHGIPPLKWSIDDISLEMDDGACLSLENVKLRIAILPLLRNQLTISYLSVEKADYLFSKSAFTWQSLEESSPSVSPKLPSLPFSFASRHLHIRTLNITNLATDEAVSFSILGKAHIKQDLSKILLSLQINDAESSRIYTKLYVEGNEKKDFLETRIDLHVPSTKLLEPFLSLPFEGAFDLKSSLKGNWKTWHQIALGEKSEGAPLQIALTGVAHNLQVPAMQQLDSSWKVRGAFLVYPDLAVECRKLNIKSSFLDLVSKFSIDKDQTIQKLSSVFVLSDLSHFSVDGKSQLNGEIKGKIKWTPEKAKAQLTSSDLRLGDVLYHDAKANLVLQKEDTWKGCFTGSLSSDTLQMHFGSDILKQDNLLSINNLYASAAEARLDGDLHYDVENSFLEGDVFFQAPSLRPFRALAPKDSNLDGSIGGELHFATDFTRKDSNIVPDLKAHFLLKNVRYFDKLVGQALVDAKVQNVFTSPEGSLSIECDNLLYKDIFFSKIQLKTEENGSIHPFDVYVQGAWKEEMELTAHGSWKKDFDVWDIEVDSLFGNILRKPFSIEQPFAFHGNKDSFEIDAIFINIAEGRFYLDAKLGHAGAQITTRAEHLPLDVLSITHPGIHLFGTTSFDGMLEATPKKKSGYLNVSLEQADVMQQGKEEHLQAKGSLQAHLYDDSIQIFSHIYATHDQFVDFTATLPLIYSFSPFQIALDKKSHVEAELTAEGELEAIFDFVNIGSHKAAGLITSHLFLSNTLNDPSLQGQIDLQNGVYENYVLGTRLKNIDAKIEASGSELVLSQFSSSDKEKGTLQATANMSLVPQEKFPFELDAQLRSLELLDYDMMSSQFTGDLKIKGNMESALIKGNIDVPEATINIFENVPLDVPELDITYINRPIHLEGTSLKKTQAYVMDYDIDVTANQNVVVRGKGLNSEWKGNLHITGKNASMGAVGTLTLVKGNFTFSGKKFTLTDGEITFVDKPTPNAFLKISGNMQMSDMQVLAVMQGSLSDPKLTFQSIPHMPTSSILARILFNKDISEITPMQAIHLANVIVSMSGSGGPDVLDAIRKSIGVDSLTIVEKDGSDEISLQVGWYLTHGVTVSLVQSATSSDVIIEVDLKHGFIFRAETQNQEEGKFSLKWNRNY